MWAQSSWKLSKNCIQGPSDVCPQRMGGWSSDAATLHPRSWQLFPGNFSFPTLLGKGWASLRGRQRKSKAETGSNSVGIAGEALAACPVTPIWGDWSVGEAGHTERGTLASEFPSRLALAPLVANAIWWWPLDWSSTRTAGWTEVSTLRTRSLWLRCYVLSYTFRKNWLRRSTFSLRVALCFPL